MLFIEFLTLSCSPEQKAERFILKLKDKTPSAIVLETNLKAETPYVSYAQTQPTFNVYKHLLNSPKEDKAIIREGKLIHQTRDSIPCFIYLSVASQIKAYRVDKGDSLLADSPIANVSQVFDSQDDSSAWFSYERLGGGQLYRLKIDRLTSKGCLPDHAKIMSSNTQSAYYMLGDDLRLYTIQTGTDILRFSGIKKMYPVKTTKDTRLVDTEENVCYWNVSTDQIDTLFFNRGIAIDGDGFLTVFDHPIRRVYYTKGESKYLIGIEIKGPAKEREMCFFLFNPESSSYEPEYLGSDISEKGLYSYEHEGRTGVISLSDDYSYNDYDFDGNLIQKRPTVLGYITDNDIHSSMILTYSDHSVCYVKGSTVESFNDLESDAIEIKSGTISTSNAGEIEVSFGLNSVFPSPDRKILIIIASNPGLFETGEYLLSFHPDKRIFRQLDFGTSVYRERDRFRVKHVNNSVSYYNLYGQQVSSGILDDLTDWIFDVD